MLAIELAKLPPPTPASDDTISRVANETPGFSTIAVATVGTSSRAALMIVQLRPPNRATAKVYGNRTKAPSAVGSVVSRNLPAGSIPNTGSGRNSTSTDHRLQIEKPMCSEKTEKNRLRRATHRAGPLPELRVLRAPVLDPARSARWRRGRGGGRGGRRRAGGCGHASTVAAAGFPAVATRGNPCSVSPTDAAPVW